MAQNRSQTQAAKVLGLAFQIHFAAIQQPMKPKTVFTPKRGSTASCGGFACKTLLMSVRTKGYEIYPHPYALALGLHFLWAVATGLKSHSQVRH
jgi:hypothetical protein